MMRKFVLSLIAVAAFFQAGSFAAAQEMTQGLICDTAEQVEQVIMLEPVDGIETAIEAVNSKHRGVPPNSPACGVATVQIERGETVKKLEVKDTVVSIVTVTVTGAMVMPGMLVPVPPTVQFAPFVEKKPGTAI